jgi:hypothetical protein
MKLKRRQPEGTGPTRVTMATIEGNSRVRVQFVGVRNLSPDRATIAGPKPVGGQTPESK